MAVKIRMTRMGRRHRPFFRINAIDGRTPRDGRILEKLGHYDPVGKEDQLVLDRERVQFWLDNGAVPSDTVGQLLIKNGFKVKSVEQKAARRAKAKAQARAKGKLFTTTEKIAAEKAAERAAAEAEAKAKAEEEARKKAEEEAAAKAAAEAEAAKAAEAAEASEGEAGAEEKAE